MYSINKIFTFEADHRLLDHPGQCRNLHGHSYKVEVVLKGRHLKESGMLMDFGDLSKAVKGILRHWDHSTILHKDDPLVEVLGGRELKLTVLTEPPTAENMARHIWTLLSREINPHLIQTVVVWETEKSRAWYSPDNR